VKHAAHCCLTQFWLSLDQTKNNTAFILLLAALDSKPHLDIGYITPGADLASKVRGAISVIQGFHKVLHTFQNVNVKIKVTKVDKIIQFLQSEVCLLKFKIKKFGVV